VLEADQSVKAIRKRVETENVAISKAYNDEKKEYLDKLKAQQLEYDTFYQIQIIVNYLTLLM